MGSNQPIVVIGSSVSTTRRGMKRHMGESGLAGGYHGPNEKKAEQPSFEEDVDSSVLRVTFWTDSKSKIFTFLSRKLPKLTAVKVSR